MHRLVFSFVVLFGLVSQAATAVEQRMNVLLITADDLGLQLNCYGDNTVATPNLNSLAKQSVRFETAYVAQASCSSSRSAMLTGTYPHTNGQYGLANAGVGFRVEQPLIEQSIPNVLKRQGYRTAVVGKLHVHPEAEFALDLKTTKGFGQRQIGQQVSIAESFWETSGEQPWFLMFNVFDPHVNGKNSEQPQTFPDVVNGIPQSPIGPGDVQAWPWQQIDTEIMRQRIAGYYNCVQRVDAAVGMLMRALDKTGQRENTLIIFLGDHGPPFSRGKTTCYESGLRVPFLVNWPGVSAPHVSTKLVSAVDIAPTVFDATGIPIPETVQGSSLRAVAQSDPSQPWRETLVGEFHFHGAQSFYPTRAITDGRYKLIHRFNGSQGPPIVVVDGDPSSRELKKLPLSDPAAELYGRLNDPPQWEFFDLAKDPHELTNLSGDRSVESAESQLKQALASWQSETRDPFVDADFRAEVAEKYIPQPKK